VYVYARNKNTATRRQTLGATVCSSNVLFISVDDFAVLARVVIFFGVETERRSVTLPSVARLS